MLLVDLNLLLYAVNRDSPHHGKARAWLERILADEEPVALSWMVLLGFLRITTSGRVLPQPLTARQALDVIDSWLAQPVVRMVQSGEEHWRVLKDLLLTSGTAGNLTTDAHLAALAIENGCTLCSTDTDFARFDRLKWVNPLG